ncbi:conserved hypothetical protein [Paraburkholderia sabiae]|uniref:hypothetical protein n=1 Tax=Paraburkholderia sabiae TaxID=273251 RepID=UPI001CAABFE0|nr:hypothetical protein [Paraburkholderia sabiae]CAG9203484.1 conserved hypothetical protein [Paraburkholderia sabiae]
MPSLPNVAAQGTPCWQSVIRTETFDLLSAYDDPQLYFALPKTASLATTSDGSPMFFLEFFSDRNDPNIDNSLYAMIEMTLEQDGDLSTAYDILGKTRSGVTLLPFTFTTGSYVHVECGDSHASAPFAWQSAKRATINARISLLTARLLYGALATGRVTIARAAIESEVPAVLPRFEATVRFNARDMAGTLRTALAPVGASVAFDTLVRFLDEPPATLFAFDGEPVPAGSGLGLALAGRFRHFFGGFAPCPRIDDGPHITLDQPAAAIPDSTNWDLRTPLMTGVPVFLRYDPFSFVTERTTRDRVTAFTPVPLLPDELRTRHLTVASGLPASFINCNQIAVTVRVNKEVSASGSTEARSIVLYPVQSPSTTVDLKYAKINSSKAYSTSVKVVGESDVTDGPWFDRTDDYLFVDASQLPMTYVTVRAADTLLAEADVLFAATDAAGETRLSGTLTIAQPDTSFLIDATNPAMRLFISASDRANPANVVRLELPCRSVDLEMTSFHEYGPQSVPIAVQFHDDTVSAKLEFAAESDDTNTVVLGFTPDTPDSQFNYFARSVFRNRYRFREYTGDDDASTAWSAYLTPGQHLHIGKYRDGARQEPAPGRQEGTSR